MNPYLFIPFTALLINIFLWTYVFTTAHKTRAGKAYLLYCGTATAWEFTEFIFWSTSSPSVAGTLFRVISPLYLSCGVLFLNFTHILIGRNRGIVFYFSAVALATGVLLSSFTDLFIDAGKLTRHSWGFLPSEGPLYGPMVLMIYAVPILYSIRLLGAEMASSTERIDRKQYAMVIAGTALTIFLSLGEQVTAALFIGRDRLPFLAASLFMVQSLFVFVAISRYRFLTVPIQQIAYDLFSRINDAVVVIDNRRKVLATNESAADLLGLVEGPGGETPELPPEFRFDEDVHNRELTFYRRAAGKTVLASQSPLMLHSDRLGSLLILKDITERTQAEELSRLLHGLGISLSGVSDIRRAAEIILDTAIRIEGIDCGAVYLLDNRSDSFDLVYSRGLSGGFIESLMHVSMYNPHPLADLFSRTEPRYIGVNEPGGPVKGTVIEGEGLRSVLMMPILHRDRPIAWLNLGSHGPHDIPEQSRRTAFSIASQIGIAIARFKAEEDLLRSSKIESLGIFAGGIAHDFNNLLTSIIGNISLATLDLDKESKTRDILKDAETASLHARDLTIQLLTFSRGGEPIRKTESIRSILDETAEFILRGSGISCRIEIPDEVKHSEIDRGQISQVIQNLLLNARQAMPSGGVISITASNVEIRSPNTIPLKPGEYVRISISDHGEGIPHNYLRKIFDPYFTTRDEGSGLGLAVSYSIIKNHDGHIAVKSEPGRGTTFDIYIPASDRQISPPPGPVRLKDPSPLRILLMDDERMILEVGERMLTRLGHRVATATRGEDAISLYREAQSAGDPFDLVIMDLTIPGGMGGIDTIAVLKEINPGVKAVVSSGYSNNPVMANYETYGFSGVIVKPYRYDDMRLLLEELAV